MTWHHQAACRGLDPSLFFPVVGENVPPALGELCRSCPARTQCLDEALDTRPRPHGIWAGTSVKQRARLRARRLRAVS